MRRRRRKQKLQYWLGILLKVLLIVAVLTKLLDLKPIEWIRSLKAAQPEASAKDSVREPGPEIKLDKADTTSTKIASGKQPAIEKNTASIYIFDENSLDTPLANQLGRTFFKGYTIKAQGGFKKEELLRGELRSAPNSELVCVGTVDYSYFTNQFNMITCRINLSFETYNRITGNKVLDLSRSFSEGGPGDSNAMAKSVALQKIKP